MSARTGLLVVLALTFGLSAALGVANYSKRMGGNAPAEETVPVVIAVVDIPRGTIAMADMFKIREYPKSVAPKGAVSTIDDAALRVPKDNIFKDEPVMEARLSPKGAGPGFANVVPTGMRVISIKTPNVASVGSGFILPGNKVDVLFTKRSSANDGTGGGSTTLLVQLVEVLAINQKSEVQSDNKMDMKDIQSATLLVSPEQMLQIDLAQTLGTLTLVLRNSEDKSVANVSSITGNNIERRMGKPWDQKFVVATEAFSKSLTDTITAFGKTEEEKRQLKNAELARIAKEQEKANQAMIDKEKARPVPVVPDVPLRVRTIRNGAQSYAEIQQK